MSEKKIVQDRWQLANGEGIRWDVANEKRLPHVDHLEMSGRLVSLYVEYGVDSSGKLMLSQKVVWPTLRTIPNDTHASLQKEYKEALRPTILINGEKLEEEKPYSITFDGILIIKSQTKNNVKVRRTLFPSRTHATSIEQISLKNESQQSIQINVTAAGESSIERGIYGIYLLEVKTSQVGEMTLKPNEVCTIDITFNGRKIMEVSQVLNIKEEREKRENYLREVKNKLRLETPEPILNQAFEFAKIRSSESVFQTKAGLMHSPGGLAFYAAIWTNDQAEYAGPFFPFLGEESSIEASLNCYRLYSSFMGSDYRTIPTSIISEGTDIWEGAGDRGDAAMYAYGAARFSLGMGSKEIGEELWPAIEWCLEYCERQKNEAGVIESDSDELEGRFPSGEANLSTASLTYGGLRAAGYLGRALGKIKEATCYDLRANALEEAIESYFGDTIEGYKTYKYYEGNDVLRSWICLPLTMGIKRRAEGTIDALFSPNLWTEDGLATQSGDITFWDRSTLYGFRGVFAAGESEKALQYLMHYSRRRTLGDHVPYAVEAYPEGDQRHLSAESALYCRIFIEGLFGITPIGFNAFMCAPNMPKEWSNMALKDIKAFGKTFNLIIQRNEKNYKINIQINDGSCNIYECKIGTEIEIILDK